MPRHVLVVVEDLFFVARIRETANHLGVTLDEATPDNALERMAARRPDLAIVDLHHRGDAVALVSACKASGACADVVWVGFYSHVDGETRARATAAGVDHVLPRSAFTRRLAELLESGLRPA